MYDRLSLRCITNIVYPMPATTIKEKEWESVATIVHKVALPKAGFVRSFPLKILHGPFKYQGVGHMHFWHDQELVHLHEYVNEVQQATRLGLKWGMTTEQL